jgi:hypothetical protein
MSQIRLIVQEGVGRPKGVAKRRRVTQICDMPSDFCGILIFQRLAPRTGFTEKSVGQEPLLSADSGFVRHNNELPSRAGQMEATSSCLQP